MSARKSKVVKVNISAGTYKDEAEAVKEANAIKRCHSLLRQKRLFY